MYDVIHYAEIALCNIDKQTLQLILIWFVISHFKTHTLQSMIEITQHNKKSNCHKPV
jgi:hypothetical protein